MEFCNSGSQKLGFTNVFVFVSNSRISLFNADLCIFLVNEQQGACQSVVVDKLVFLVRRGNPYSQHFFIYKLQMPFACVLSKVVCLYGLLYSVCIIHFSTVLYCCPIISVCMMMQCVCVY